MPCSRPRIASNSSLQFAVCPRSTGKCRRHSCGASLSTAATAPKVRGLAAVRALEGAQPVEDHAARLRIRLAELRLGLEMLAARLVGALRGLMEALPVRVRIADHALADRLPVLLQLVDPLRERARLERRADERFHLLDQRRALGRRGVLLPVLELAQGRIELLHLARERRRHERQRGELLLERAAQPRRASRAALAQRALRPADRARGSRAARALPRPPVRRAPSPPPRAAPPARRPHAPPPRAGAADSISASTQRLLAGGFARRPLRTPRPPRARAAGGAPR